MSTSASIANFAVDVDGNEVPIRYKAEDLVNHSAPDGYFWQKRRPIDDKKEEFFANYDTWLAEWQAAWDKEKARLAARTQKEIEIDAIRGRHGHVSYDFENYLVSGDGRPVYNLEGHWRSKLFSMTDKHLFDVYYIAVRIKE
jgi:hypothetical protein